VSNIYSNPDGMIAAPVVDTEAFATCPVNSGLTNLDFRALAIDPTTPATLYAGRLGGGVFSLTQAGCISDSTTLCVDDQPDDRRFKVTVSFDTALGGGRQGDSQPISLRSLGVTQGGVFTFFDPKNPELLVKVLNFCGFNDRYWVFWAATTNVGFEMRIEDTAAPVSNIYSNPDLTIAEPVVDTEAFATCP
jgi:hypothetical protein